MLYPTLILAVAVTACFQNIVEADKVGLDIGIRIGDAIAYACLCREIDDDLWFVLCKELVNERTVGDIALDEGKIGELLQLRQAVHLQTRVVVVVHIVDTNNRDVATTAVEGLH